MVASVYVRHSSYAHPFIKDVSHIRSRVHHASGWRRVSCWPPMWWVATVWWPRFQTRPHSEVFGGLRLWHFPFWWRVGDIIESITEDKKISDPNTCGVYRKASQVAVPWDCRFTWPEVHTKLKHPGTYPQMDKRALALFLLCLNSD